MTLGMIWTWWYELDTWTLLKIFF